MPKNAALVARSRQLLGPDGRRAKAGRDAGGPPNDLDLTSWRSYEDIITDSLWVFPERDSSGAHCANYHGNFVPQIPNQVMRRYSCPGEVVLDPFLGMGTTAIEGRRLGRHVIGIELQESVCRMARSRMHLEPNPHGTWSRVICGDSRLSGVHSVARATLTELGRSGVQLVIMHPPYHDIIHFSNLENDLSNAKDLDTFLGMFGEVVRNCTQALERNRYLILVIGDKYADGQWVPLGSRTMDVVLSHGYTLKSWIVKNMCGNRGKRNLDNLWRYRALRGGFYIFKHEHVLVFRKD
jgi:hypothetical protein